MSFIFKITTTTSLQTFVIPCGNDGTFNATVDYGDGTGSQTVTAYNDSNLTHSFATAGQHTITINGTFPNVNFFNNAVSRVLVDEVVDLGDVNWINLYQAFRDCTNLTAFNAGTADTSSTASIQQMFFNCNSLTALDLSSFDTSSVTIMQQMFQNCSSLTSLDLSGFDTSSVTSMAAMFQNCNSLTSLNLSGFNTSSVNNMYAMFRDCSSLTSLDVSGFNTSSVTTMSYMFYNCNSLTSLNLSGFNTSSVINMSQIFRDCSSLTSLNISGFNTSSVTTMHSMFRNCSSLTSLNISNFDTSSVTIMESMFNSCSSLTALNLSNFDTSNVTRMTFMIFNCSSLINLDIKHFDISSVTSGSNFLNFSNIALTTVAYDELLEAWAAQDVQPNVPWHFGNAQYTVETIADWYSPRSNSSLSIINNKLVSIAGSTGQFGAAQQVDNLIIGNTYKIVGTATCSNSAASVYIRVSPVSNVDGTLFTVNSTGSVTANATFIATATTHYVGTIVTGHAANDTVTIDAGITVKEVTNYTEANAASEIEYSQENVFGSEEVVNGDFATDLSGWAEYGAIWSFGRAYIDAVPTGSAYIEQTITDINKAYLISANLEVVQGIAKIQLGSGDGSSQPYAVGVHKIALTVWGSDLGTDGRVYFARGNSIAQFYVDNVSVKEITNAVEYKNIPQSARELYTLEDDTWTGSEFVTNGDFATDLSGWVNNNNFWSWSSGRAFMPLTSSANILNQECLVIGTKVRLTFNIEIISGSFIVRQGTDSGFNAADTIAVITTSGTYSYDFVVTREFLGFWRAVANTSGSIDNVSVKEIVEVAP